MKYPIWKPILILIVLAACSTLLWPPQTKLKRGIDLAGGTTMVYDVKVPQGADARQVIDETIAVLQRRVDPSGVRNLVWRQIAGNRIEIQMALPSDDVKEARENYIEAREDVLALNINKSTIDAALKKQQAEREADFQKLSGGNEAYLAKLQSLYAAYRNLDEAAGPYKELTAAYAEAQKEASPNADEMLQQMIEATEAYVNSKEAYNQQENEVLASNLTAGELDRVLDLTTAAPGEVGIAARQEAVNLLKTEHPNLASQIDNVVTAFNGYVGNKGLLDDPNDLIALLRGSGILEFRIVATPNNPIVNTNDYLTQLREKGPRFGINRPYRWFKIQDVEKFIEREAERRAAEENPGAYFASRGLVGDNFNGDYYVLLGNANNNSMTKAQGDWSLTRVYQTADQQGFPAVSFQLNAVGAQLMGALTGAHQGEQMAIVLDGQVISAPTLQSKISSNGIITGGQGGFQPSYLRYLVQTLKAGSLEGELSEYPISIKTTGPSLGQDNLTKGLEAAYWAIGLVAIFMLCYYFWAGAIADFALLLNMVIILGVMSMVQATFTLPGIAGIVLTIGMAVDANVLIFERIREELESGRDTGAAVREGFGKAFSTILDANITTLITCLVLGYTASAEVKGFAVTLGIGIIATLFTALFCTRTIIDTIFHFRMAKSITMLPTLVPGLKKILHPNVDWVAKRYAFFAISCILIVAGFFMVWEQGNEMLDIEFRSGTQVSFDLREGETLPISTVRERIESFGIVAALIQHGDQPTADEQSIYNELKDKVSPIVAEAKTRYENAIAEYDAAIAAGEYKSEPDGLDFEDFANSDVVTEGQTQRDDKQTLASAFSISTLMTDSQAVSDLTKIAFEDSLETTKPIDFDGVNAENVALAPVFAIKSADLGADIGQPTVSANVSEYIGGVATVVKGMSEPQTTEEIAQRITRMRFQPAYQSLGHRAAEVIGINQVGTKNVTKGSRTVQEGVYDEVVVITNTAGSPNYAEDPDTLDDAGGFADTEWNLIRDALQRDTSLTGVTNFSSQVSSTMKQQAIVAMVLSLLAVVAYIWFRFGSLRYGIAAIFALVHDVAITLGLVAICGWLYASEADIFELFLLDPFKINLAMIAALLTIVGYSLNDTIVVFDRIRENKGRLSYITPKIINDSINQTISRTILTSSTTLLAVITLYTLGGSGVHGFAFAMIIGVVVGTYSSIAIASPTLLILGAQKPSKNSPMSSDGSSNGDYDRKPVLD
ncbi:bifunctional preprotein translocase subunit SecD/SecF [Poriferisphaera corsica]|uniref:Multifunctional fusion protein n=1 Tax=Poriferisphaera corsica TaxID=2528020 RepID=A0A517YX07_9BACT|nr:protein translocase subunit SecD [Poriferisphaera corsica]QDU34763.1 bifunctional preprotein translocase subunit SecD/SecF [Poriferisphaera corsica]